MPLSCQIPELKNTLVGMKEAIDKINSSLEKENDALKSTSRKSSTKRTQKLKRSIPNPILIESTPRFKILDDAFNKQKWKKESPMQTIREENNKSPFIAKSSPRPKLAQKPSPGNRRNLKNSQNIETKLKEECKNDIKQLKLPPDGNMTERPYAGSPTLEELLSNSRFTIRDEVKLNKQEDYCTTSDPKQSLERSVQKKDQDRKNTSTQERKCAVSIAEGFLRNPLISQLASKELFKKTNTKVYREPVEEDTNSKLSIRSYSPINSIMLLEKEDL